MEELTGKTDIELLESKLLEKFRAQIPHRIKSVVSQIHLKGKKLASLGRVLDTDVIALSGHVVKGVTPDILKRLANEAGAQVRAVDVEDVSLIYRITCIK